MGTYSFDVELDAADTQICRSELRQRMATLFLATSAAAAFPLMPPPIRHGGIPVLYFQDDWQVTDG